jgi:hypothetical protein
VRACVVCVQANGFKGDQQLRAWDVAFWSERQSEQLFGFKEEEVGGLVVGGWWSADMADRHAKRRFTS